LGGPQWPGRLLKLPPTSRRNGRNDIDMPALDGFEMMSCIRAVNPSVRTIYVSGSPQEYRGTLAAETQQFGAAVLRKPFAGIDLLKLIPLSKKFKEAKRSSIDSPAI
jgi:CheY-like chemotaxis protein